MTGISPPHRKPAADPPFPLDNNLSGGIEWRPLAMTGVTIGLITTGCVFGGTLLGLALRRVLPDHHLNDDSKDAVKVSVRDISSAINANKNGGTTVSGTLAIAQSAGIKVFATGGIGGVHRQAPFDVSADLAQLAKSQLVVVCAGAKAILDIPATLEVLETYGVPVIGFQTDEFPAFYSLSSGLPVSARVDTPEEVAMLAKIHWGLELLSSILVVVPPPPEVALDSDFVEAAVNTALEEAEKNHIHGQQVTPFLLSRVSELSGGLSLKANLGLLRNNARVAAKIAHHIVENVK